MPTIRERDGVYHADVYYFDAQRNRHVRKQRSTRIKVDGTRQAKRTAEAVAREIEASLAAGQDRVPRVRKTLKQAYADRITTRELEDAAKASLDIIVEKSEPVLAYFGPNRDVCAEPISAEELKAYAIQARHGSDNKKPRAVATVDREIRELCCALRAAGLEPPKRPKLGTPSAKELWFDMPDSSRLISCLAPSRRDHAWVYRLTGASYSELYKIEAKDLSPRAATPLVRIRGTKVKTDEKGGRDRTIPMHPRVEEILRRRAAIHPRGALFPDRWLDGNGNRDLTLAARRAGLLVQGQAPGSGPGLAVSFNVLRASFCTELVLAGVPLKKIAYMMGHKTTKMVERVYTRFFGAEVGVDLGAVMPIGKDPEGDGQES